MSGDDLREIQDPLFARVNRPNKSRGEHRSSGASGGPSGPANQSSGSGSKWPYVLGAALVVIVSVFGYLYYQSQQRFEALTTELATSKEQLAQELASSKEQIGSLQEDLTDSQTTLQQQRQQLTAYKGQVANLKDETAKLKDGQEEQSRNLEMVNLKKADREQVEQLEGQTQQIQQDVGKAQAGISDLRGATSRNQAAIEGNKADITKVGGRADALNSDLSTFKQSFERDIYKFELDKKSARMEVFNVSLDLKKTDVGKQRFNLEIFTGGRKITKKNQSVNEPIVFYVEGISKPYEVVVTKVGKDYVVGHLSVPKKGTTDPSVSG